MPSSLFITTIANTAVPLCYYVQSTMTILLLLQALAQFVSETSDLSEDVLSVWSSTMKRARQTSKGIKCTRYVEWRALREIEASYNRCLLYQYVHVYSIAAAVVHYRS
jgi:hypothetical protein